MSGRKATALKENKDLFLASLIPATDILHISVLLGLSSDERDFIMAAPGLERKVRLYDHLIQVIEAGEHWNKLIEYLQDTHRNAIVSALVNAI